MSLRNYFAIVESSSTTRPPTNPACTTPGHRLEKKSGLVVSRAVFQVIDVIEIAAWKQLQPLHGYRKFVLYLRQVQNTLSVVLKLPSCVFF